MNTTVSVDGMTITWRNIVDLSISHGAYMNLAVDLAKIVHADAEVINDIKLQYYSGLSIFLRRLDFLKLFSNHKGYCPVICPGHRLLAVSLKYYRLDEIGDVTDQLVTERNRIAWCPCCHMIVDNRRS